MKKPWKSMRKIYRKEGNGALFVCFILILVLSAVAIKVVETL